MLIVLPFKLPRGKFNQIKGLVDSELYYNPVVKNLTIDVSYGLSFEILDVLPGTENLIKSVSQVVNSAQFPAEIKGVFAGAVH